MIVRHRFLRLWSGIALLSVAGCAGVSSQPPAVAAADPAATLPRDVHWVRNAAEYRALTRQTYHFAENRLRELVAGRPAGSWAVILDGDETVLDNSEYQRRLAITGGSFSSDTWYAWVREESAGVVPGAAEFLATVRSLGGRIAIVTNRDEEICEPTRANMRALDLPFDVVLCRREVSDKNPRFESVAAGTASPDLPPAEPVLWVGDNIQDFPRLTQAIRERGVQAFEPFGRRFIILPNPMYGSWESNEPR